MQRLSISVTTLAALPAAALVWGVVAGGSALAQTAAPATPPAATAPPPSAAGHQQAGHRGMPAHVDDRIAAMHRRLQITSQQEPAWNAFAQVMRDNAATAAQAYQDRAEHLQSMTAPENLHAFAQLEQTRAQGVQTLATAFDTLYGQLSDDQKRIADGMFRRQGEHAAQHHGKAH